MTTGDTTCGVGSHHNIVGTVEQAPNGRWRLRWRSVDANGRNVRRSRTVVADSEREARQALANAVAEDGRRAGRYGAACTVYAAVNTHLDRGAGRVSEGHRENLVSLAKNHVRDDPIGAMLLGDVTTLDVEDYLLRVAAKPGRRGNTLSKSVVTKVRQLVSNAYNTQARLGLWTGPNPVDHARMPTGLPDRQNMAMPDGGDIPAALLRADDIRPGLGLFVRIAAVGGLRRGEVCGLRWSDADWTRSELFIRRTIAHGGKGRGVIVKPTKGTGRGRVVDIDRGTLAAIELWAEHLGQPPADHYLFGGPIPAPHPNRWSISWAELRDAANLTPKLRMHDLRHNMASQMISGGTDIATVSKRLGHARISTTLDFYAHAIDRGEGHADGIASALGI